MNDKVPSRRNWWLVFGGAFSVLAIAGSALSAAGWLSRHTQAQDTVYQHNAQRIVFDLDTGDVALRSGPGGQVTVHRHLVWSWTKPTFTETWDGDVLRITSRCPVVSFGPSCSVDFTVTVPVNVAVEARTSTGDIEVTGLTGQFDLTSDTGDITLTGLTGPVAARTDTGNISGSDLASPTVESRTDTGDVTLRLIASPSSVTAQADTGDISIVVPAGERYRVRASTATGSSRVGVATDPTSSRELTASTDTGDVRIDYAPST